MLGAVVEVEAEAGDGAEHAEHDEGHGDDAPGGGVALAGAGDVPAARVQLESARANMRKLRVVSSDLRMTCAEPAARVAQAEGEMVAGLPVDGVAILNADDAYFSLWAGMTRARVARFGIEAEAEYRAVDIVESLGEQGFTQQFTLVAPVGRQAIRLNVGGRHNVRNALAAAAAACNAGATLADVAAGLAAMQPVQGRLQPRRSHHGARLIDDSYNANPSSMRAGIDVVTQQGGQPWLVMGDMGELGEQAASSHVDIGAYARAQGIQRVYATGPLSRLAVEAFGPGALWFADTEALARAVDAELTPQVCLLVKGSRSNRLERVVAALTGQPIQQGH